MKAADSAVEAYQEDYLCVGAALGWVENASVTPEMFAGEASVLHYGQWMLEAGMEPHSVQVVGVGFHCGGDWVTGDVALPTMQRWENDQRTPRTRHWACGGALLVLGFAEMCSNQKVSVEHTALEVEERGPEPEIGPDCVGAAVEKIHSPLLYLSPLYGQTLPGLEVCHSYISYIS